MLTKLFIRNYAIIKEIQVDFCASLNIITGETGAGKSIVMGALGLILGERAESNVLNDKANKCIVEGVFDVSHLTEIKNFFLQNELDESDEIIIRREIAPNGKSRAFINDTPVALTTLKKVSSWLVDLHQQFDTLELGDNEFQREVIDALADNTLLLQNYKLQFQQYLLSKKQLAELMQKQVSANAALDYNQFLFDELEDADLKENELEELDTEIKLLSNAESIKQQLSAIYTELKDGEQPMIQQLKSLVNKLTSMQAYHPDIDALKKRMESAQLELKDISDELESIDDGIKYDAERIQIINDKISLGYKLLKKHNVNTTNELLVIKESLQSKLNDILNLDEEIARKEKETNDSFSKCNEIAEQLSLNRNKAIKPFEDNVNQLLVQVGMPNAILKVKIEQGELNTVGLDTIEFLFDANKSNRWEPLGKVASGGELSRLMLCIKNLVAQKLQLPTLIFDEIDTGISGEAAKQVGNIMKKLSASHQLIAITHQPQIAAKADAHYFVYKSVDAKVVSTSIRLLDEKERVLTIAKMIGGENPTAAALENAKDMLSG